MNNLLQSISIKSKEKADTYSKKSTPQKSSAKQQEPEENYENSNNDLRHKIKLVKDKIDQYYQPTP